MSESMSAQGRSLMEEKLNLKVSDNISERSMYELDLVQENVTEILEKPSFVMKLSVKKHVAKTPELNNYDNWNSYD